MGSENWKVNQSVEVVVVACEGVTWRRTGGRESGSEREDVRLPWVMQEEREIGLSWREARLKNVST